MLSLGFPHDIVYPIPDGIKVDVQGGTAVSIEGIDKQLVGQVAHVFVIIHQRSHIKEKGFAIVMSRSVVRKVQFANEYFN